MENLRQQLILSGAVAATPLGKAKPSSFSVPIPRTSSALPRRRLSEAQRPPPEATSHPPRPLATVPPPPVEQPIPGPSSSPSRTGPTSSSSKFALPRITAKDWSAPDLCSKYDSFKPVRRVSACAKPEVLSQALVDYERDGIPLVIEQWNQHPNWPKEIFSLEWLLQTSGDKSINVRNMHDRRDQSMTLTEFVELSRSQTVYATPGETQRWYWKDADCPLEWRDWLFKSSEIPTSVLPSSPDNYLRYLSPSEAVESLLCYMGIGDTYTAAHKDLCSSSGHNLMCVSENNGRSFWFMTAANDAAAVAKYFHKKLGQELDWETHVTTLEELGRAPFTVYVVEQRVGDLVLVPPRSCHQVVNSGGLAMKTSWSRMTLDNLRTALHCELPIYRRVCRPEQYRVRTVLYRSMLHLTQAVQAALAPTRTPKVEHVEESQGTSAWNNYVGYADSSDEKSIRAVTPLPQPDVRARAQKLKRIVQLFDEVLRDEFAACHAKLEHVLRSETGAGWALTATVKASTSRTDSDSAARSGSSNGLKITLQPPAGSQDRRDSDRAASCNLACDFCGADIFQSFFECKECRTADDGSVPQPGDGLLICPACYVEGRSCDCRQMEPMQTRSFDMLLSDRNDAARAIAAALPSGEAPPEAEEPDELWDPEEICVFEAACALRDHRAQKADRRPSTCRAIYSDNHPASPVDVLNCVVCHGSKCFHHLLRQGIHSAEAVIIHREWRPDQVDWHTFHKDRTVAAKQYNIKAKLFDLESIESASERLKIAALSFPKCRPGHANVKLGFYDRECGAMGISVDEPEVVPATPSTPKMSKAEPKQPVDQLSPLTPVNSSDESAESSFDGSPSPVLNIVELPSTNHLPFLAVSANTSAEESQVKEVIEIEYSDTDSQRSLPGGAHPLLEGNVPYVAVPPLPPYVVSRLKRASSPSRFDFATQPRKKPKPAGRGDPESSALTTHTRGSGDRAEHSARHRRDRSGDKSASRSSMVPVADNSAAMGLVGAFQRAAHMNNQDPPCSPPRHTKRDYSPPPRTIKKPHVGRRAVTTVVLSDSEPASTLPSGPSSAEVLTSDMNLDYPDVEEIPRPSLPRSVAPQSTRERAPAPVSGTPQIPRRSMLKRTVADAELESDKAPERTTTRTSTSANSLASLGRIPKKRKGPPGISKEDMAKRQSEEKSDDAPKTKGKSKATTNLAAPGMSRRSSRASDSRAMVSSTSGRQSGLSVRTTSTHRTRGESSLNGSYILPDDVPDAAAPVCAAIAESASRAEDTRAEPSAIAKVNSPPTPLPRRSALVSDTSSVPAFPSTSFAPVLPALPQAIVDPPSRADDYSAQFTHSAQTIVPHLSMLINSGLALASAPRSNPRLEEEVKLLHATVEKQHQQLEHMESENVELRRQVKRQAEKIDDLEQEAKSTKGQLRTVQDSLKKEREERNLMAQEVRNMDSKIGRIGADSSNSSMGMAQIMEMVQRAVQERLGPMQPVMQQAGHNPGYNPYNGSEGNNNPPWGNQPPHQYNNNHINYNNNNNGPTRNFNHPSRGGGRFYQGRDTAPQTTSWDRNQNRYDDTSRGRNHDVRPNNSFQGGGPRDHTRTPPEGARSEFAPAGDRAAKDEDAEPLLPAGRSRPNADVSPVSEFSDHGKRHHERTPPSTIESYPSPPELGGRSLSSIQNSSFPDVTDARNPPNSSSYPSPGHDQGLRPNGERSSRGNSRGAPSGSA
ncbi:hypothetical protein TRAPUB_3075 [Trametes pubescens]|uniref:JmjC domain-containing protein n=1 Tax=Trametes pubescens TaxID=154538 RepID=A0A1M2VEY7_TRAPU|nr:hypothetical protein TRAPUB_3075 [Trametes pubescens]